MVSNILQLHESRHPDKTAEKLYNQLICIDDQKSELLRTLLFLLDGEVIKKWKKKHHNNDLNLLDHLDFSTPLLILSGEVGCGKTLLAQTIGTPLAKKLDKIVKVFETPSNIRGSGLVGEISNRITEAFESYKGKVGNDEAGILIIDEADDIATSRAQNQAHHEDRAGLNVLIKQLDQLKRVNKKLAVIMITNRVAVLDPAIRRRTVLHLTFERPTNEKLKEVLKWLLVGIKFSDEEFQKLWEAASNKKIPFSFSDLIQRIGKQTIVESIEKDIPYQIESLIKIINKTEPTPLIENKKIPK